MINASSFCTFMVRVRSGDEDAARELVRRFGGLIRREIRLRVYDRRLLRVLDSMDIAQSVLNSFFAHAWTGHFAVETPEELARLLIGMTRKKVAFQRRRQYARKRDCRLTDATGVNEMDIVARSPNPGQVASDRDLIDAVLQRMSDEERQLVRMRADGWEWPEIAVLMGGSAQARRMQLARAVHRISRSLKLEDIHA
jgi:RNA polymerase sigma-70 factor (ECF subfamily)